MFLLIMLQTYKMLSHHIQISLNRDESKTVLSDFERNFLRNLRKHLENIVQGVTRM